MADKQGSKKIMESTLLEIAKELTKSRLRTAKAVMWRESSTHSASTEYNTD